MTKLPICSGEEAIRAFQRAGWVQDRQHGSHVTLTKSGIPIVLTVPLHSELGPGLLRALIRKAGLTPDQFRELL
ncbi:MAG: type II toxin-antitoxin system HicA family toxin [Nitrospiraceae bacterium]